MHREFHRVPCNEGNYSRGREGGEGASAFTVETIEGRYRVERLEARYWLVIHVEAVDERPAKFT